MPPGVYPRSEEHKRKISKSLMGHAVTEQTREKLSKAHTGRKQTEEHRLKSATANLGKRQSAEWVAARVVSLEKTKVFKDGRTRHPLYDRWYQMMARCFNENHRWYHRYGGRGIAVCEEWKTPANFYAYIDGVLGDCPVGYSLDRIDNDGNYEPGNVRWATQREQIRNSSITRK